MWWAYIQEYAWTFNPCGLKTEIKCSLNCAMALTGDREETKRTSVAGLPGVRTIHSAITTLAHKFSPRNATYGSFKAKNKEFFARLIFHRTF